MDLKDTIQNGMTPEKAKHLDIDTFGEIMDDFIQKSEVALLIRKKENSKEWDVMGAGCGAIMDFYIFLNALGPILENMLEELERVGGEIYVEKLVKRLAKMIKATMIDAIKEKEK